MTDAADVVTGLILGEHTPLHGFRPEGTDDALTAYLDVGEVSLPATLAELDEQVTRAYDLTVTAAADAQIPLAGLGSGGLNRRIIVLERAAFRRHLTATSEQQFGYAIRLCVAVNKWEASTKISLPFLAASAQLGSVEAQWTLQVIGLSGKPIDTALVAPTELNVDTFVIAKQSLEKLVDAVHHRDTTFRARLIGQVHPPDVQMVELRTALARAYALSSLDAGRTLNEALAHAGALDGVMEDAIAGVYEGFGGLTTRDDKPARAVRLRATELCGRLRTDIPWFR